MSPQVIVLAKQCTRCEAWWPLSEYTLQRRYRVRSYSSWCKPCAARHARVQAQQRKAERG